MLRERSEIIIVLIPVLIVTIALVLIVYDLLRGHADGLLFSTWYRPQLEADAFLLGGTVPTVWLQDRLWQGSWDVRWYDYASWAVYMSYFVATYLIAGLLWFFARARFRRYVGCVALLAGMAYVTFALSAGLYSFRTRELGGAEG